MITGVIFINYIWFINYLESAIVVVFWTVFYLEMY